MQSGTAEDTDAEAADAEDELAVGSFSLLMACFATRHKCARSAREPLCIDD